MPSDEEIIEPLDLNNIIEIQKIKELLTDSPELLIMFETIINICNKKLNEDEDKLCLFNL